VNLSTNQGCTWYIRHVNLFDSLADRDAVELARLMASRRYQASELIVGPHTHPGCVFVARSGVVRLFHGDGSQHGTTVERLPPGRLFGVTQLLGRPPHALFAEAETDADVCQVEEERFVPLLARWPRALLDLALRLGVRVLEGDRQLGRLSSTGARARLAGALRELAQQATEIHPGGGLRLRGVPRHADLADQIGASRETVTRMLARLEHDGYIRRYGRQIVVPDLRRLVEDFDLGA
jgi:CRP-like cAMP-binding protein